MLYFILYMVLVFIVIYFAIGLFTLFFLNDIETILDKKDSDHM